MTTTTVDVHAVRRLILERSYAARAGHIGSALSIADILTVLFGVVAPTLGSDERERDQLVLSKGHAALALYVVLHLRGILDEEALETYCEDGSCVGVHAEHQVPGVDFSTGSLGQGLGIGAGRAWGARAKGSRSHTFVVMSDAELDEGSIWEAVMFAGHHRLANLTAIVDLNGQQALAPTADVIDLGDIGAKFVSFGWNALVCDGHDPHALEAALRHRDSDRPLAVIAQTVSGHGVPFMERTIEWHYRSQNADQYREALATLLT